MTPMAATAPSPPVPRCAACAARRPRCPRGGLRRGSPSASASTRSCCAWPSSPPRWPAASGSSPMRSPGSCCPRTSGGRRARPPRPGRAAPHRGGCGRGAARARRAAGRAPARPAVLRRADLAAVLVIAGGGLLWRQAGRRPATRPSPRRPGARGAPPPAEAPRGWPGPRRPGRLSPWASAPRSWSPAASSSCEITGALAAASDVALAAPSWRRALGVIFAPWMLRCRPLTARARRAHPLAGARGGRRAPARLGPADARARAEARRPTRATSPRSPAARSASCARGWAATRAPAATGAWPPRCRRAAAEVEEAHGVGRRSRRVGDRRPAPRRRRARRRRPRGDGQRREVRRRRAGGGLCRAGRRARPGLRPRPRPGLRPGGRARPTGAACASRSSGAWRDTAGARSITSSPAEGTEVELVLEGVPAP